MASASSSALGASRTAKPFSASPIRRASADDVKRCQCWVVPTGRMASLTSVARACWAARGAGPGSASTSSRGTASASSSFFKPYCGCSGCGACSGPAGRIASQLSWSSVWSSPGSTTAPFGNPATTRSSSVTAGTLLMTPATITGALGGASCSRFAWARIRRLSCCILEPRPSSTAGKSSVTIFRKSSVLSQCAENSPGTRVCILARSTSSISIWSISSASSAASLAAWAGVRPAVPATGAMSEPRPCALRSASDHRSTSLASSSCRSRSPTAGGMSASPPRSSALRKVPRSSEVAKIGRIFGSSSAAPCEAFRNASCSARVARRVGNSKVTSASCSGSGRRPPGTGRLPASSASASDVRNGRPCGTV